MDIIKRHGAQRKQGLSDAQVEDAIERYELGESVATIGKALGASAETVRSRLLDLGVPMRLPSGRYPASS